MPDMDLRGIPCPLNFVRTKLRLEKLAIGERLEVWLDAGEPVEQVPHSLEIAGHRICKLESQPEGHYRLVVQRGS
jgi:TusA-related sulfurtransferase